MEKTLFLSLAFMLPILLGALFNDLIIKYIPKKYSNITYDVIWTWWILMVLFWLLQSIVFIWPKISIVLWFIILIYLFSFILTKFLNEKTDNNDINAVFIKDNFKQFFIFFTYIIWVAFFIGWNLSFFSNMTIGSILIEVLKFVPIFALLFSTMKFNLINMDNDKKINKTFLITYFSLFWLLTIFIFSIEKLFKFYIPNAPIILQIILWFFLLIFLIDNRILNTTKWFMSQWYKYQLSYVWLLSIIIILLNI